MLSCLAIGLHNYIVIFDEDSIKNKQIWLVSIYFSWSMYLVQFSGTKTFDWFDFINVYRFFLFLTL